MAILYKEVAVGGVTYAATAQVQSSWIPDFHQYRIATGTTGGDVFFSCDGVNDHGRIPYSGGAAGAIQYHFHYSKVFLRAVAAGLTATIGVTLYTRQ